MDEQARILEGAEFFFELGDGDTWIAHPAGQGIIVANPDRQPLWCRFEDGCYRQDFISPATS